MFDNASITCRHCSRPYVDQGIKKPEALQLPVHSCGRWDLNPHVLSDTRSLVLPVCQFQHSRATRCILAQRKPVGNNFFHFSFLLRDYVLFLLLDHNSEGNIHKSAFLKIVYMKFQLRRRIQEQKYTRKKDFRNRVYKNRDQPLIFFVYHRFNIHDF